MPMEFDPCFSVAAINGGWLVTCQIPLGNDEYMDSSHLFTSIEQVQAFVPRVLLAWESMPEAIASIESKLRQ